MADTISQTIRATEAPHKNSRASPVQRIQQRRVGLRPLVKDVDDGVRIECPSSFPTELGVRRVPRRRNPLSPSPDMIVDTRKGVLSKFLRLGKIIRASNFKHMANPITATLHLTDSIRWETEHLSDGGELMPENKRTLKNLFYVSVEEDELPSYHFWKMEGDPDPIDAQREIDRSQVLTNENSLPDVIFHDPAKPEQKTTQKKPQLDANPDSKSKPSMENAHTENRKHHREKSSKRDSAIKSRNKIDLIKDAHWRLKGRFLQIPYHSSDQRKTEGTGQFGPLPGDPEWDHIEKNWEQRLEKEGLDSVIRAISRDYPERNNELRYGGKSSKVKPARGNNNYAHQFNTVLSMAVPTVAFKLTQQHFGRPVSPLNYQEPLTSGQAPKCWGLAGEELEIFDGNYEVVQHNEDELEFLDFYNEKSNGEPMLRRRKRIPEEHVHRQLSARALHLQGLQGGDPKTNMNQKEAEKVGEWLGSAFVLSQMTNLPSGGQNRQSSRILIEGRKGGLFLGDTSYDSFCIVAGRLVAPDISEGSVAIVGQFYVQIRHKDKKTWDFRIEAAEPHTVYHGEIQPALMEPDARIRVGIHEIGPDDSFGCDLGGPYIRVVAKDIGYYNAYSGRNFEKHGLKENSKLFVDSAIRCLFSIDVNEKSGIFMVHENESGWHTIDLSYDIAVGESVQEMFGQLLRRRNIPEVRIHREPLYSFVRGAGEEFLEYSPPLSFGAFLSLVEDRFYPLREFSQNWKIVIIYNDHAWSNGSKLGPFGEVDSNSIVKIDKISKNGQTEKEIAWIGPGVEKWNELKATYFRESEIIRVVRCFDMIRVYDGTSQSKYYYKWKTTDIYESSHEFDPSRIMSEVAGIAQKLLNIDPLKEGLGVKILGARYKDADGNKNWLYLNYKMSPMDFLHQFLEIEDERIYMYPLGTDVQTKHQGEQKELPHESNIDKDTLRKRKAAELKQRRLMELEHLKPTGLVAIPGFVSDPLNDLHAREGPRLGGESVYGNPGDKIKLPQHGPSVESEILGGPDTPSLYARVFTISEINALLDSVRSMENEILQREKTCRVCSITFPHEYSRIGEHYKQHQIQLQQHVCPYCSKDWTGVSKKDQINHLESTHRPGNIQFELEKRISDGDDGLVTVQGHVEHSLMHKGKSGGKGGKKDERPYPGPAQDRQPSGQPLIEDHDGEHAHKEIRSKPVSLPVSGQEKDEHGRLKKAKGQHYHCGKCFLNINNKPLEKQEDHLQNCGITLDMMVALPPGVGREMRKNGKANQAPPKSSEKLNPEADVLDSQRPPKTKPHTGSHIGEAPLSQGAETSKDDAFSSSTNNKTKNKRRAHSLQPSTSQKRRRR